MIGDPGVLACVSSCVHVLVFIRMFVCVHVCVCMCVRWRLYRLDINLCQVIEITFWAVTLQIE